MKLLVFVEDGVEKIGVHTEAGILDLAAAARANDVTVPSTIHEVIEGGQKALAIISKLMDEAANGGEDEKALFYLEETALTLGPCVTRPEKIICIGLNYRKHAEETNAAIPASPVVFSKFANALTGHQSEVPIPKGASAVDYEVELAIVIGSTTRDVEKEAALEHVFGYCCANDLSEREWQMRSSQWILGKACDGFAPMGPYLVTADEISDPNELNLRCTVNGEIRQNSNTSDMIFRCDEIVSYLSKHMTLQPGDVILTGTPEGVVLGLPEAERVYLKSGDHIVIEIEKLGRLENTMV
ncbi:5-carboxymethyl-2-hydroxymuconate isomerase [Paenibacillus sp. FSL H8-0548]|uniref:fumarylacetoacetate hydrolase family protein n=1 Tax=Paenibacillus sp. FSL H8-0548 TaxID=1920422 RepID=UPI00096E3F6E|nr:fumarylacetoacetate hydrolase family protein [Paenibacillus sp. FSL H8-0548]OMF26521.1 5-carboxymethyl-2-hydroxymuconate isomerase [Paenibacillus sp. FSL H8-0548]